MNSELVLSYFKEITAIPRESGHEEHIIAYLQKFAAAHALECKTDAAGNVLIVKPAAAGFENVPSIVLQSPMAMPPLFLYFIAQKICCKQKVYASRLACGAHQ